jgi:hypothetical protein
MVLHLNGELTVALKNKDNYYFENPTSTDLLLEAEPQV